MDKLLNCSREDLLEDCMESHKDFYGVRGRHMINYTKDQLVAWFLAHYKFVNGVWLAQQNFVED